MRDGPPRLLVVRRDNIGDLVLTTPLVAGLRARYPDAWIGMLVNTYNAPVLEGNPDIDAVFAYRKAKHGEAGRVAVAIERVRLVAELRRRGLDAVILATPAWQPRTVRFARWLGARRVVGFVPAGQRPAGVDTAVELTDGSGASEAELVWRLGAAFDLTGEPPAARVVPDARIAAEARAAVAAIGRADAPVVGIHISARKPSQRWPLERFAAFMRAVHAADGTKFLLFWAPGAADNPMHPGDDDRARELLAAVSALPVLAWPTAALPRLIGGMAACDRMFMADGGAMHVAAALGKPVLALFGKSDARRWRPWRTKHQLLQTPGEDVEQITVAMVLDGYDRLLRSGAPA